MPIAGPTRGWGMQGCTEMGCTATRLICDTRALTQTRLNNKCIENEVQCIPAESSGWALSRFPVLLLPGCLLWGWSQVWHDGCEQELEPMPETSQQPQGSLPPPPLGHAGGFGEQAQWLPNLNIISMPESDP